MVPRTVLLMITPYSQPRLEGISRFARAHGWNLMMEDRLLPDEDPRQYDGVLMTLCDAPEAVATARRLLRARVPTVDLTIERPDVKLPRVVSDHAAIGRAAAAHFRERGFSSLAWFSSGWSNVHRLRYEGFHTGCAAPPARWTRDGLADAIRDAPKPVGVLTYNDVDAARLVAFCRASGFSVPDDVAVLGIGNDTFLCENQAVPLSSVEQDLQRNAYEGAELLARLMSAAPPVSRRRATWWRGHRRTRLRTRIRLSARRSYRFDGTSTVPSARRRSPPPSASRARISTTSSCTRRDVPSARRSSPSVCANAPILRPFQERHDARVVHLLQQSSPVERLDEPTGSRFFRFFARSAK